MTGWSHLATLYSTTQPIDHLELCGNIVAQLEYLIHNSCDLKWNKAEDVMNYLTTMTVADWHELCSQPVPQRASPFLHAPIEEARHMALAQLTQATAAPFETCKIFVLTDNVASFGQNKKVSDGFRKLFTRVVGDRDDLVRAEAITKGRARMFRDLILHYHVHDNDECDPQNEFNHEVVLW